MTSWTLVREFGIDYALPAGNRAQPLAFPAAVHCRDDGTYLIVDELSSAKFLSISAECRTIRVDRSGRLLFDSAASGMQDAYGCVSGADEIALLHRTRWLLTFVSDAGEIRRTVDLSSISKGMPRLIAPTWKGTFLVAFYRRVGDIDVVELDRRGRLLWYLPRRDPAPGFAGSVQLLPNDNVLVADEFHHTALELRRDGTIDRQFGVRADPAGDDRRLSNPKAAVPAGGNGYLIADTRNHRVLWVYPDGAVRPVRPQGSSLCMPSFAASAGDDRVLICDAGNRRVVELDAAGRVTWQYGQSLGTHRWFSFPRSVELTKEARYLVADTANNRIVEVAHGEVRERAGAGAATLFWPRCARSLESDGYLVADSRHARVIHISPAGEILRELSGVKLSGWTTLGDPHDVRLLDDGRLLIVDSEHNLVIETDWEGRVGWVLGERGDLVLNDPHGAQRLSTGEILICDTGNSRVVRAATTGRISETIEAVRAPSHWCRMIRPRYAEVAPDGTLVVADSDNNRVLGATIDGEWRWDVASIPQSPLPSLNQPRWLHAIRGDEIVVSDSLHHRVLHLRASPAEMGAAPHDATRTGSE